MTELISAYYSWLSSLAYELTLPVNNLAASINVPLVSALLFGLMGATAPCQLSTNVAALAYLSRRADDPRQMWSQTIAFVAGKVTVYLLLGGVIVALGLRLSQITAMVVPGAVIARRALGPLLVLVGLLMLGLFQSHLSVGSRLSTWLEGKARGQQGVVPAYLLGTAFSFTFCPTLFWLFFGLTLPLAVASPGGLFFPGIFALGTALPVLALAALLSFEIIDVRRFVRRFKAADVWLQRAVGAIFVLVGLHEIILYWLI